jgi:hypothetical protein
MKFTIRKTAPRNPLVAPSRFRQAGSQRQQAGCARHREIERLKQSP